MSFKKLGQPNSNMLGRPLGGSGKGGFKFNQLVDFEGGNIVTPPANAWDSTGGAGVVNLLTTAAAAMHGNFGAEVGIPGDGLTRFGELTSLDSINELTLQFLFDTNSIVMGNNEQFNIVQGLDGAVQAFSITLLFSAGNYSIPANVKDDGGGNHGIAATIITDGAHQIRFVWRASTAPGNDNGEAELYIDGVMVGSVSGINNDTHALTILRLGAVAGVDAGTNGTIFIDEIQWANRLL